MVYTTCLICTYCSKADKLFIKISTGATRIICGHDKISTVVEDTWFEGTVFHKEGYTVCLVCPDCGDGNLESCGDTETMFFKCIDCGSAHDFEELLVKEVAKQ